MRTIYNIPGEEQSIPEGNMTESTNSNIENKFISSVTDIIINALKIGHNDRRIVEPLLNGVLSKELDRRYQKEGLLQQYQAYVLEEASERLRNDLGIPKEIKVNHEHASHAKYADFVKYLKAEDKEEFMKKFNKE